MLVQPKGNRDVSSDEPGYFIRWIKHASVNDFLASDFVLGKLTLILASYMTDDFVLGKLTLILASYTTDDSLSTLSATWCAVTLTWQGDRRRCHSPGVRPGIGLWLCSLVGVRSGASYSALWTLFLQKEHGILIPISLDYSVYKISQCI